MAEEWLVDSIVGFLSSPRWTVPINNFMEANCLEFTPEEENKLSYTPVHKNYQALVEELLEGFLAELGLSGEQLAAVLDKEDAFNQPRFTPNIFATIVAADDFLLFKSLMVNKNVELELETRAFFLAAHRAKEDDQGQEHQRPARPSTASRLHRARTSLSDTMQARFDESRSTETTQQEEELLERALQLSLDEYKTTEQQEDEDLQRALKLSAEEHEKLLAEAEREEETLQHAMRQSLEPSRGEDAASSLPPISAPPPREMPSGIDSLFSSLTVDGADADAAERRRRFASQRQRIVEKRMSQRRAHLDQYNSQQIPESSKPRPMSLPKPTSLPAASRRTARDVLTSRIRRETRQ